MSNRLVEPRYLYLHGFASSPASRKAQFFREKLAAQGIGMEIPELDGGDFENLTISRQLAIVEQAAGDGETVLIGSSLGGYLASLYAAKEPRVRRLCLLAPAFGFLRLWEERLGRQEIEEWREQGRKQFFHYGLGRETQLGFELIADAQHYELVPEIRVPTLIFHGNQDDVVPVESSVQYARDHQNAELVRLEAGHELTEALDEIWARAQRFLLDMRVESE